MTRTMLFFALISVFALASQVFAQDITEGGNVTHLVLPGFPTTQWDGIFGEVVPGTGANYSYIVIGNNVASINMVVQSPNCTPSATNMHIIAINSTSPATITFPLVSGNLSILEAFINNSLESNGTFTELATLNFSYGTILNVPSLHTNANNSPSPYFREFYLNDGAGNLVFVADVVNNQSNWNGTTSDYQIILPNNGSPTNYTLWVEMNYTCESTTPDEPGHHTRELYVYPPGVFEVSTGTTTFLDFTVENRGDFAENNILLSLICPAALTCGSGTIPKLHEGENVVLPLPITVGGPGEYVLTVCAENAHDKYCVDFIVRVMAECASDDGCTVGEYCANYTCELEKPVPEPCVRDGECQSGICADGYCASCFTNQDCGQDEACSGGSCIKIPCPCGRVADHGCVAYQCCADSQCGACNSCLGNSCVPQEVSILVSGSLMAEGETALVQVLDSSGRELAGANVFTRDTSAITDAHGRATIPLPYDGLIYAKSDCAQAGLLLEILRKGIFVLPENPVAGQETWIALTDSAGKPIPGATVAINGTTMVTDADGKFGFIFQNPGEVRIRGNRAGYLIADRVIYVVPSGCQACGFPMFLGWFSFACGDTAPLWGFSIVFAFINFYLVHRRVRGSLLKVLAYCFIPVVLAIPYVWVFNICAMSNAVLLQFLVEAVLLIRRAIPLASKKK